MQASKELPDSKGRTPLFLASQNGHARVVRSLLEDGADTERANDQGWMPLHAAYYGGHTEIMQLLLNFQADINAGDKGGFAPLHLASFHGNHDVVRMLLERNADVNVGDKMRLRPLHAASMQGHHEVVKLLLKVSRDSLDVQDDDYRTPLFFAAAKGHSQVVQLLISYSAKLNVSDRYNTTPLGATVRNGHEETVRILLPLADSTTYFEGGLGRNLAWWATKSGCPITLHLVQQWAQKMGVEICESDLNVEYLLIPPMASQKWCDVCTRTIPSILAYYRCESCAGMDICLECHELGAQCREALHEWSLHDANGEKDGEKDEKDSEKNGEQVHAVCAQEGGQEQKKFLRISFEGNWIEEGARAIKQDLL